MRGFMEKNSPSLYSNNISLSTRIYSFEVKVAKNGAKYLTISESNPKTGQSKILIFEDHLKTFLEELDKAVKAF